MKTGDILNGYVLISVHDLKKYMKGNFYGSCYKVFRQFEVDELLKIWTEIHYLSELFTRCRLVYKDQEFRNKCIKHYNEHLKKSKLNYPNILEIQWKKELIYSS